MNESFARSFIGSMDILARGSDGEMLIDITDFLKRDALGVIKSKTSKHNCRNYYFHLKNHIKD